MINKRYRSALIPGVLDHYTKQIYVSVKLALRYHSDTDCYSLENGFLWDCNTPLVPRSDFIGKTYWFLVTSLMIDMWVRTRYFINTVDSPYTWLVPYAEHLQGHLVEVWTCDAK